MKRIATGTASLTLASLLLFGVGSVQATTISGDGWWRGYGNYGYSINDRIGFCDGRLVAQGPRPEDSELHHWITWPAMWDGSHWEWMRGAGLPDVRDFVTWHNQVVGKGVFRGAPGLNVAIWNGVEWQVLPRPEGGEPTGIESDGDQLVIVNRPRLGPDSYGLPYIYLWDGANWQLIGSDLGQIDRLTVWAGLAVVRRQRSISTPTGDVWTSDVLVFRDGQWQVLYEGTPNIWVENIFGSGQNLYMTTVRYDNQTRWTQLSRWDSGQWIAEGSETQYTLKYVVPVNDLVYAVDSQIFWDGAHRTSTLLVLRNGDWQPAGDPIYGWIGDAAEHDGDVYVAGYFDFIGGQVVNGLARFDGGSLTAAVERRGGGADERVRAILPYQDGVVVAGSFSTLDNQIRSGIAYGDGQTWEALGDGLNDGVFALAEFDGDLIAGGDFDVAGNGGAQRVARWNGETWMAMGDGFDDRVTSLIVYSGELYAGGWFQHSGAETCRYIARWDGQAWRPVAGGMDGRVLAMAVYENRLFVGGDFHHAGSIDARFLASFDGTTWAANAGLSGSVYSMTVWGDQLVMGGGPSFLDNNGTYSSVALWNGADLSALDGVNCGWITALGTYRGSLVAGGFCSPGYYEHSNIAFWNGSEWKTPQSGLDGPVLSLGSVGSDLFIGGLFDRAGGQSSRNLARWNETLVSAAPVGFTSSRISTRVELSWTAAEITNNRGYEVYRARPEGGSDLLGLAQAGPAGHFSFTDSLPPSGPAGYLLRELGPYGTEQWHGPFEISSLPPGFTLSFPTPNPFRETTRLEFTLASPGRVTIEVHDVQGRLVRSLQDTWMPAGVFESSWDGRDDGGGHVSTGIYWVLARANGRTASRKALLFR